MPTPPAAKTVPYTFTHLGHTYSDLYFWLQDKSNPEVLAYLEAENAYSRSALAHTAELQEQLFQEMRARIAEDDSSAPQKHGAYEYYWRVRAGQQYKIYCRKSLSNGVEEVLLDENILAEGKAYCRVFFYEPSPDHKLLAYSVDTTGSWVFDLYIKDLQTGIVISGPIPKTAYSAAWASDSRTLFYTIFDDAHRSYKLMRHFAGEDSSQDMLVYHETDDAFMLEIDRTRSGGYLFMNLHSATTSEVHYLPADQPAGEFRVVHPRQHWMEYYLEHAGGDRFLIRTNEDALNFKLMEAPVSDPAKVNWREILPNREEVFLESVNAFRSHLVLFERSGGLPQIRISASDGLSNVHMVNFPDAVYTFRQTANPEFDTRTLRFDYNSLVTPVSTVDYDMESRTWDVKKVQEIPSGYDPSLYISERLHAAAQDGAKVPISLVYRKGLKRDGNNPLLLMGYGSYGISYDPTFDSKRLSLLDRGFVVAIAHIRGGSDLGRGWYEDGRLTHKMNTFTDFITCAEHLIAEGYTSPSRLAILGGSAGGLLVTAVTNLRPDLFKSVVALVPFTNVITAMLDPNLPLTVIEYEQWGNPHDPAAFEYMLSYSPYENITPRAYPQMYIKAGLNDLQVPYWDPAKWVAKLRVNKTDDHRLLLVTNMGAGHGGSSGRYDHLREDAEVYAFLLDTVG